MNRTTLRSGAALTLALAATAATALPAAAHVRVIPEATASGGYAAITFRVPNESDTAATIKLVVTLPQDRPLATVSIRPVPGWTAKVTTAKLPEKVTANDLTLTEAPRTVTWTADYDLSEDEESQPASADTLARVLGGLALVVALVGAGVAVAGRRRA